MTNFWTNGTAELVALFANIMGNTCGCVLGYSIGGVTIVASVTEQSILNSVLDESSYYEVYSITKASFTPPHALTIP